MDSLLYKVFILNFDFLRWWAVCMLFLEKGMPLKGTSLILELINVCIAVLEYSHHLLNYLKNSMTSEIVCAA
jgi:hypothetical protein